jgi:hypothetical protein
MRKSTTMGPAAMEWILATLRGQGKSLVDTSHICYIIKGRPLNNAAIYWWNIGGRESGDVETVERSIDVQARSQERSSWTRILVALRESWKKK